MKGVRKRRQQLAKEMRSRQRQEKFNSSRQKFLQNFQDQSLVSLIFLMIDKDQEQISPQCFQDFLQIISQEIINSESEQIEINEEISTQILQRYGRMLEEFLYKLNKCEQIDKIRQINRDKKMFNLIRFLFRLQVIQERFLVLMDTLLQSCNLQVKKLVELGLQLERQNKVQNQRIQLMDSYLQLLGSKLKVYKEIAYLSYISKETNTQKERKNVTQLQNVNKLTDKWIRNKLLLDFIFQMSMSNLIITSHLHKQKYKSIFQQYRQLYLGFITEHQQQHFDSLNYQTFRNSPQKIIQLLFVLFSCLEQNQNNTQIQISNQIHQLNPNLLIYLNLTLTLIKTVQSKISQSQSKNLQDSQFYNELLNCTIDSFIDKPYQVFERFVDRMDFQGKEVIKQCFNLHINFNRYQKQPLIVKLLKSIQDFQYHDLVTYVELLSIIVSYNDRSIGVLFEATNFDGYYEQKLNFEIILEKKLLHHVSIEIRRRAIWLLSNITGSEEFYFYGLKFVRHFYIQNILQEDYSSTQLSKQQALIKESILQTIMNYLSNLRTYEELEEMLSFNSQVQNGQNTQGSNLSQQKDNRKESMFVWIIKILASVTQSVAANNTILKQGQKFLQVLIYSLYNLLSLQSSQKSNSPQKENIVLSILQSHEIVKNLQSIYHDCQSTNQFSTFFTMLETLLDFINKIKQSQQ